MMFLRILFVFLSEPVKKYAAEAKSGDLLEMGFLPSC
jgi:hypothetical protein